MPTLPGIHGGQDRQSSAFMKLPGFWGERELIAKIWFAFIHFELAIIWKDPRNKQMDVLKSTISLLGKTFPPILL